MRALTPARARFRLLRQRDRADGGERPRGACVAQEGTFVVRAGAGVNTIDVAAAARDPVSPWAVLTKGYKTRKNKRTGKDIVRSRHTKKMQG